MSEDLDRLLAVGDLDTTITQLQHKRAGLAEKAGLAAVETELSRLDSQAATATMRRAELVAVQKDLESQIATLNERRESIEQRMYAATGSSTRDLQAMSDEVRHLSQRRAELEEQELVAMVDQEPIDAELSALAAKRAPLDTKAEELRVEVAESAQDIDAQLVTAVAARATEAALLPSALAERYEALRQRLKGVGVARLIGHRCDGCHLELSSVEVERIRHQTPDALVTCDQCGRILVPT
jgi:predicted  nucleic acid-binding Zn-ribbon protein